MFSALNRQLKRRGLIEVGMMIDAAQVEADAKRPLMRDGEVPEPSLPPSSPAKGQGSWIPPLIG